MNKTCLCAFRFHATSCCQQTIKKVLFQPIINFPQKFFRDDFDSKHGYKTVSKKSQTAVKTETGTRENLHDHWLYNTITCYSVQKLSAQLFNHSVVLYKRNQNQTGDISTLEGTPLKLVDKFTYLGSSVESTEKDIEIRLTKAWTAINRLSIIWKSDLTDKMKRSFFQAAVTSILLYVCTTWTLTKRLEKKLDGNYTRMLRAILNKSWRQHPTRHQLYGHLPPITKTIQVRRTKHAGHCWRSRDELISDVLLWTPTDGWAKAGRPARTYIQQLCEDTGCCPEDLPRAMNNREEWRERVRDIRATSTT